MPVTERIAREKAAYDEGHVWEESHEIHQRFHHLFECENTQRAEAYFESALREFCQGSKVLDYGCLDGGLSPQYKRMGAKNIIGIDISERGIHQAKPLYGGIGDFYVCDAHELKFIRDQEVDFVVGRSILHHLEFERAVREVFRVLRVGGTALFAEPLFDNPAAKIFRRLTPRARTEDERPLSRQQIQWADRLFSQHEHHYCNLVSTPVSMLTSILGLSASNPLSHLADYADRKLEKTPFRYWMRMSYLLWQK